MGIRSRVMSGSYQSEFVVARLGSMVLKPSLDWVLDVMVMFARCCMSKGVWWEEGREKIMRDWYMTPYVIRNLNYPTQSDAASYLSPLQQDVNV